MLWILFVSVSANVQKGLNLLKETNVLLKVIKDTTSLSNLRYTKYK